MLYREVHLLANLGWVDFDFDCFHPLPGSAWADGKLAELAGQDGGTSQIKVNPTEVRQEIDLPVQLIHKPTATKQTNKQFLTSGFQRALVLTGQHAPGQRVVGHEGDVAAAEDGEELALHSAVDWVVEALVDLGQRVRLVLADLE